MIQPRDTHLAELNIGRLVAPVDDPRVADFMNALDLINGIGRRSSGFQWIMESGGGENTGNTGTSIGGDPQMIPNLTVWESVETLEAFVWNTVHRKFYERRAEWFEVLDGMSFVMWWVPIGHRPTLEEALAKLAHLQEHGDTDEAFGWAHLEGATLWKEKNCNGVAA